MPRPAATPSQPPVDAARGKKSTGQPPKVLHLPRLPNKDADVANVALAVARKWATQPHITLVWATAAQFMADAAAFETNTLARAAAGGQRPATKAGLRALDKAINEGASALKISIQQKFGKAAAFAHYSRYGIEKEVRGYLIPRDRARRLAALPLVVAAVQADGTGSGRYDVAFWTDLLSAYRQALEVDSAADGRISTLAATKNRQKKALLKVMRALQLTLQANYPDTYEAVYRAWGWQKEDY